MPTSEKMASAKCCLKEYYLYNIIQIILAKLTNHRRGKPNYPKGKDQEDNTQQLNKDKKKLTDRGKPNYPDGKVQVWPEQVSCLK